MISATARLLVVLYLYEFEEGKAPKMRSKSDLAHDIGQIRKIEGTELSGGGAVQYTTSVSTILDKAIPYQRR